MLASRMPGLRGEPNSPARECGPGGSDQTTAPQAMAQRPSLLAGPKLFASPVLRILSEATGETVGVLYEWNTGERQPIWLNGRVRKVGYAPLKQKPCEASQ